MLDLAELTPPSGAAVAETTRSVSRMKELGAVAMTFPGARRLRLSWDPTQVRLEV